MLSSKQKNEKEKIIIMINSGVTLSIYLSIYLTLYSRCILATDMAHHNKILNEFKSIVGEFDYNNRYHRLLVRII